MNARRYITLIVGLLVVIGTICVIQAWRTPVWRDNEKAFALENRELPYGIWNEPAEYQAFNQQWHAEMDALRTARYPLYDFGTGLIALAACIALATLTPLGTPNIGAMQTPSRRWHVLALAAVIWTGFWVGTVVDAVRMVRRFDVPPWADTLAIPIFTAQRVFVWLGLPFLFIIWVSGVWGASLPENLWLWKKDRPWVSWGSVALATIPMAGALLLLGSAVISGPFFSVPVTFGLNYLVLTLRAGGLNRFT